MLAEKSPLKQQAVNSSIFSPDVWYVNVECRKLKDSLENPFFHSDFLLRFDIKRTLSKSMTARLPTMKLLIPIRKKRNFRKAISEKLETDERVKDLWSIKSLAIILLHFDFANWFRSSSEPWIKFSRRWWKKKKKNSNRIYNVGRNPWLWYVN